ncbi:MAG: hypothetical protein ACYCW6_24065 [Candidatus Xenobia bacterium]
MNPEPRADVWDVLGHISTEACPACGAADQKAGHPCDACGAPVVAADEPEVSFLDVSSTPGARDPRRKTLAEGKNYAKVKQAYEGMRDQTIALDAYKSLLTEAHTVATVLLEVMRHDLARKRMATMTPEELSIAEKLDTALANIKAAIERMGTETSCTPELTAAFHAAEDGYKVLEWVNNRAFDIVESRS